MVGIRSQDLSLVLNICNIKTNVDSEDNLCPGCSLGSFQIRISLYVMFCYS